MVWGAGYACQVEAAWLVESLVGRLAGWLFWLLGWLLWLPGWLLWLPGWLCVSTWHMGSYKMNRYPSAHAASFMLTSPFALALAGMCLCLLQLLSSHPVDAKAKAMQVGAVNQ